MDSIKLSISAIFRRLFRLLRRRRRLLAALLLCAAAAVAVEQLTPVDQFTASALSATADLPTGTVLSAAQLKIVRLPPAAVPDAAFNDPEQVIGQQLAAPLRRGQLLTDASLLGHSLLIGAPPGTEAVPVRVADPATMAWLLPGQLVTVVLSIEDQAGRYGPGAVLASAVPVLWIPAKEPGSSSWSTLGESSASGLVLLAAPKNQSKSLAGASSRGKVSLVLVGG
ncbi:Flp pilus assembly protein CpaB [Psychromicrobium silvestre]|uniref:Flp pilus assembly protein CpaB n=1 Tax=Psychromicrobium silvestre TaxID=1645614 RepID=A0A7Y9S5Z3_9MICC|nr:RcpC/CpaB family pilus assembly protein [Psychromicrobium silvestre]NYE95179.1 Flp pilus assembly protein CpaB [Psychromicrobium silvestre]